MKALITALALFSFVAVSSIPVSANAQGSPDQTTTQPAKKKHSSKHHKKAKKPASDATAPQ